MLQDAVRDHEYGSSSQVGQQASDPAASPPPDLTGLDPDAILARLIAAREATSLRSDLRAGLGLGGRFDLVGPLTARPRPWSRHRLGAGRR